MGTKNGSKLGETKMGHTELFQKVKLKSNTHTSDVKRESEFKQGDLIFKTDTHMRGESRDEMIKEQAQSERIKMSQDQRLRQQSSAS